MARYFVVGGAGRTGSRVVARLRGHGDDAVVASRHPGADNVALDLTGTHAADPVFDGYDGVVVSVEPPTDARGAARLLHHGVGEIAAAAVARDMRLVLVSQIYISRPDAFPAMSEVIAARGRGEDAIRASGVDYAIVRPGWLHDGASPGLRVEQGDRGDGRTSRDGVAEACVELLLRPVAARITFELFDDPGGGDLSASLAVLEPDRG